MYTVHCLERNKSKVFWVQASQQLKVVDDMLNNLLFSRKREGIIEADDYFDVLDNSIRKRR